MGFALDYIDVATRIVEFRTQHPDGSLQQVEFRLEEFAGKSWVIYTAAAYRSPEDARPGIGTAWEPVPGKTNFTRDSEMQNAETAAWGRAIVAALAADTKKGIASAEEIRNREPAEPVTDPTFVSDAGIAIDQAKTDTDLHTVADFIKAGVTAGKCSDDVRADLLAKWKQKEQELAHVNP